MIQPRFVTLCGVVDISHKTRRSMQIRLLEEGVIAIPDGLNIARKKVCL